MLPRSPCWTVNSYLFCQIFVPEVIVLKSNKVGLLQQDLTSCNISSFGGVPDYQGLRVSFNQLKQSGLAYNLTKPSQAMEELIQTTQKFHKHMLRPNRPKHRHFKKYIDP